MSFVSGKCDFLDHLSSLKHRTRDGSDNIEDLANARVLYSDLFECFEIFKKRTNGIVYQHKKIKEITPNNHDFVASHCDAFKVIENTRRVTDARTRLGYRDETYYTYEYYGKMYSSKEISKRGVYITVELHLDNLIEAIPYFPYIVSMYTYNGEHETIYLSDESYVEEEYDSHLQYGWESGRNHYHKELAELTREIVLNYFNPSGYEVEEELTFAQETGGKYIAFTTYPVDDNFPIEWIIEKEDKSHWTSPKLIDSQTIEMSIEDYTYFIGHTCKVKYVKYRKRDLHLY